MPDCPTCGREHPECFEDLLLGMYIRAHEEAKNHLSPDGVELLGMLALATEVIGEGDAWIEAAATRNLSGDEVKALEVFLARVTLIQATQNEVRRER